MLAKELKKYLYDWERRPALWWEGGREALCSGWHHTSVSGNTVEAGVAHRNPRDVIGSCSSRLGEKIKTVYNGLPSKSRLLEPIKSMGISKQVYGLVCTLDPSSYIAWMDFKFRINCIEFSNIVTR